MGRLIIDGNSVFEIDEECLKKRPPQEVCDIEKYYKGKNYIEKEKEKLKKEEK